MGKVVKAVKKIGRKIDKAIIQPVINTVKATVKDPRALAGVALTMAFPGAGAYLGAQLGLGSGLAAKTVGNVLIKTVLNGGDVKSAVISSAIPIIGQEAGNLIGKALDSSGITGSLNSVLSKAAASGLTAEALGKDPVAAMTFAGVSAATPIVTSQIPGFGDLPEAAKAALTKSVTAQLTGKDPSQALFQSVIDSSVKVANNYLKPEFGFSIPQGLLKASSGQSPQQPQPGPPPRPPQQGIRPPPRPPQQGIKPPARSMAELSPEEFQSLISKIPAAQVTQPKKEEPPAALMGEEAQPLVDFGADFGADFGIDFGGTFEGKSAADEKIPFGKAFAQARVGGAKTFDWNGKSYTTELASDAKPPAASSAGGGRGGQGGPTADELAKYFGGQSPTTFDSIGGGRGGQGGPTANELAEYSNAYDPYVGYGNAFKVNPATYKDINDVNDPKTLAFVSGLMGTAPDQLGYSVLNPNAAGIRSAGSAGFAAGTAAQMIPAAAGLRAALPSMRGPSALENYLAGSVTQKPLFHGTSSDIAQFSGSANKSTTPGIAGWLAENPEYASQYARGLANPGVREGANVMPVYASIKKPMDLDDPDVLNMIKTELPYIEIPPPGLRYALTEPRYGNALTELARLKGYDAFKVLDEGQSTFAPLSPMQMKSAIGNRGTYDPFDQRLNYAKGGVAKKSKSKNQMGIMALAVKRNLR